ncbi:Ff.00g117570.m01.CDS01 [Fusarium sp. VM40]|nr:Ff.00g117570.m01.CDS01 [Fusarium sp. VM40]
MLPQSISQAAIMATFCLTGLASADVSSDASTQTVSAPPIISRRVGQPKPSPGNVMKACGSHISLCGAEDEDNVIYIPRSTITKTNSITSTSTKVLKPTTLTVTQISVSTVTDTTKGHCRKTVTAAGPPVEVTVDVKVVKVQEIQSIGTTTKTDIHTVTASAVEQCFLETYTILAHGSGGSGPSASLAASSRSIESASTAEATHETEPERSSYDPLHDFIRGESKELPMEGEGSE